MNRNDKRALHGFRLVQDFLDRNPLVSRLGDVKVQKDALAQVVEKLTTAATTHEQATGVSRRGAQARRELIRRIRAEHLAAVRRVARVVAPADTELRALLVPGASKSAEGLLVSARAVAQSARAAPAAYAAAGLASDLAEQLDGAVKELQDTVDSQARQIALARGASVAVREASVQGRRIVGLLNVLLRPALAGRAPLGAEWATVRRRSTMVTYTPEVVVVPDGAVPEPVVPAKAA